MATTDRPLGVTLAAVTAILGAAIFILLGLVMLLTVFVPTPQSGMPPPLKVASVVMCCLMLGLAAWGITTAAGLFRLRSWSRWFILAFSALLVFFGGSTTLIMTVIPLPPTPGESPEIMKWIRIVVVVVYGVPALMGAFWLYYFNTTRVRTKFGSEAAMDNLGRRPLSVSVIAWFLVAGAAISGLLAFTPLPGAVFGVVFTGWTARVFYLAFAGTEIWIGIGLLRLNSLSRWLAIALFGYGPVNSGLFLILPGYSDRLHNLLGSLPAAMRQPPGVDTFPATMASIVIGSLVSLIPIWFLIARRQAFKPQQGPPDLGAAVH